MIRALFLDLDGTLADTIDAIREAVNMTVKHFGYSERSYEQVRTAIGNGARKLIERSIPKEAADDREAVDRILAYFDDAYATTYLHTTECYAGIVESLCELRRRGYILAVLSNKQDPYVKGLCAQLLPKDTFALTQGQTALPTKPDPTVPRQMADALGVKAEECAFIGDSEVDIQTARNAGMLAVGCEWGYRDEEILLESGADLILHEPSALLDVFLGVNV